MKKEWHKRYFKHIEDSIDGGSLITFIYWNDDWAGGIEEKFCSFDGLDQAVRFQEILKEAGYSVTDEYPDVDHPEE